MNELIASSLSVDRRHRAFFDLVALSFVFLYLSDQKDMAKQTKSKGLTRTKTKAANHFQHLFAS
eukprot:m.60537 g.60537  ORF g.60537 m.60537 type:complete len:64 (-) comp13290_c0_seq2:2258-2449(-)